MLIILDRDGVINHDEEGYIGKPEDWHAIDGSLQAIAQLNKAGHQVVVATNQSGIGRGFFTEAMLEQVHQKMHDELTKHGGHLDGVFMCTHHPDDKCQCRKPDVGLLLQIADALSVDLKDTYFIGDSLRDLQAAQKVGAQAILVKTGNGKKTLLEIAEAKNILVHENLADAVSSIIEQT